MKHSLSQPREFADHAHADGHAIVQEDGEFVAVGHEAAVYVAQHPGEFSSQVSAHLQIPNGLDGAEHQQARELIDAYLAPARVNTYLPDFLHAAREAIAEVAPPGGAVSAAEMGTLAELYAVRAMQKWLGWPKELTRRLIEWVHDNDAARGSRDRSWTARVAAEFDEIIAVAVAKAPEGSETHKLATSHGLEREEIVSILRNWTAGDIGSMARCIEVIAAAFSRQPRLQERVRTILAEPHTESSIREFEAIANEILRIDDPFVSNRRKATCPVTVGGVDIPAGARVRIHWTGANRDPKVFAGFDPVAHADDNLVWGIGDHACPGKDLSLLELRAFWTEVLSRFDVVE